MAWWRIRWLAGMVLLGMVLSSAGVARGADSPPRPPALRLLTDAPALPDLSVRPTIYAHTEHLTTLAASYTVWVPEGDFSNEDVTIAGEVTGGRLWSSNNGDRSSLAGIIEHLIQPGMSEREQALAIWRFIERETYGHGKPSDYFLAPGNLECQGVADTLLDLWRNLGGHYRRYVTGENSMPTGGNHYTSELFWNGKFHIVDANQNVFFPTPWGELAGFEDLVADSTLYQWQEKGKFGYYAPVNPDPNYDYAPHTDQEYVLPINRVPTYTLELRRGERMIRRWWTDGEPRWGRRDFNARETLATGMEPEHGLTTGELRLTPDFAQPPDNVRLSNVRVTGAGADAVLTPADPSQPAVIEVTIANPFLARQVRSFLLTGNREVAAWVSGVFEATGPGGEVRIYARDYAETPLETYTDLGPVPLSAAFQEKAKVQPLVRLKEGGSAEWGPWYLNTEPQFRIVMQGSVRVRQLEVVGQFQFNSRALPELRPGKHNEVFFAAEAIGPQGVTVTHRFRENTLRFSANPVLYNPKTQSGPPLTLTARVTNRGGAEATNVVVDFRVGPVYKTGVNMWDLESIGRVVIPSLPPGASQEVSLDWDLQRIPPYKPIVGFGPHFVTVVVDPDDAIAEADESNNETGRLLNILRPANVMTLAKYLAYGDGWLWTWVTYPAATLDSHDVELRDVEVEFRDGGPEGRLLGRRTIPVMLHSEATVVAIPVATRPAGQVTVIVDPDNRIPELDESDNVATGPVRDQAPPAWARQ
ncbi:MAG: hypothetical protein KatS3mg131_3777 [Candidatus Tectimicrobiota bacterium]|nr:MAG: hypothetical protein KatS3mg131_3777 [Candidatus Tectomicrobia bacterium]